MRVEVYFDEKIDRIILLYHEVHKEEDDNLYMLEVEENKVNYINKEVFPKLGWELIGEYEV